jgi:hypothetical protein
LDLAFAFRKGGVDYILGYSSLRKLIKAWHSRRLDYAAKNNQAQA